MEVRQRIAVVRTRWMLLFTTLCVCGCGGVVPVETVRDPAEGISSQPGGETTTADGQSAADQAGVEHTDAAHQPAGVEPQSAMPVCEQWETPAVAFAVTGQVHGYMEPCGCADPQYGGIARRDALLNQLTGRGWNLLPVDLGGINKRSRQQSQFKFQTMMSALRDMHYQALALGLEEVLLGPEFISSQHVVDPDNPDAGLSFLCANMVMFQFPDLGTPRPWKIVKVGEHRVGLTAVFGPGLVKKLPSYDPTTLEILDPREPVRKAISEMQSVGVDLMVLLLHADPGETRTLVEQFPEFPLVLSTGVSEEPLTDNPTTVGRSVVVNVGHKSKYAGIVGWYPDRADSPFQFELVKLDGERFKDTPRMLDHMRYYQDILRDSQLVETEAALKHTSEATFVGASKCGECHTKAFEKWSSTGHATAFDSLRTGRRGIPRIHDPECVACHVTGWDPQNILRYESGFLSEQKTAHLLGNQCENCHGPGSRHIELVEANQLDEARRLVRVTLDQARDSGCYSCHDLDNSPHFEFDAYWAKIAHPGLD